jgi:sulfopropanediol 3-dehydrogenase
MKRKYIKESVKTAENSLSDVRNTVQKILENIETNREKAAREIALELDKYNGNLILTSDEIEAAKQQVSEKVKDDIRFSYDNVRKFAEAQKKYVTRF